MSERNEKLRKWIDQIAGKYGLQINTMKPASSDASFRSYFRIQGKETTYIVMDCPSSAGSIKPFVKADEVFAEAGLNVPKIYEEDAEQGFLLCSDLGTVTYLDIISNQNAKELMSDATDALVKLQLASKPGVFPIYSRGILLTELELFPQWYVARHLGYKMSQKEHEVMTNMFNLIVAKNLDQPSVYVHRDYMPRNLMVTPINNPGVLDFQDALYGPISYDITCLCRDAFISWEEEQVIDWTIRYWEKARKAGLPVRTDFGEFWTDVEWMGLQRHLKVIGIFARINYRDGKPKYLGDVPRFFNYINKTTHRYDALRPLANLLDKIQGIEHKEGVTF